MNSIIYNKDVCSIIAKFSLPTIWICHTFNDRMYISAPTESELYIKILKLHSIDLLNSRIFYLTAGEWIKALSNKTECCNRCEWFKKKINTFRSNEYVTEINWFSECQVTEDINIHSVTNNDIFSVLSEKRRSFILGVIKRNIPIEKLEYE